MIKTFALFEKYVKIYPKEEHMADLKKDVKYVKGVGPNRAKLLNRLNIYTLEDLITYFPREHEDRSKSTKILK